MDDCGGNSLKAKAGPDGEPEGPQGEPTGVSAPPRTEECRICYSPFDVECRPPRQLECLHTFCLDCLSQVHQAERCRRGLRHSNPGAATITCPLCRHRTALPDGRVSNLPVDRALAATSCPLPPKPLQPVRPSQAAAQPAQQRPLPDQGGGRSSSDGTAPQPLPSAVPAGEAEPGSGCHSCHGRPQRLVEKIPWVWVAFCLLFGAFFSIAFISALLWNWSPWVLFLGASLCCILPCCLILCYTEIRRYQRESPPCPPCLVLPF
ncbi:RING finger protein 223 [Podarcis raffonei]|uniref:RING finger protein 223 n=1 Tax=Podarcis raffonei TaxID=65483 RepID=UPI00232946C1|nr:RING finger protein 223 [Podarcis raffonei]